MLRSVNNLLQSKKKVEVVYGLLLGLAVFGVYYLAITVRINEVLIGYNESNVRNFRIVNWFINLDRSFFAAAETLQELIQFSRTFTNHVEYLEVKAKIEQAANYSDAFQYIDDELVTSYEVSQESLDLIRETAIFEADVDNVLKLEDRTSTPQQFIGKDEAVNGAATTYDLKFNYLVRYYITSYQTLETLVKKEYNEAMLRFPSFSRIGEIKTIDDHFLRKSSEVLINYYNTTLIMMPDVYEGFLWSLMYSDIEEHFGEATTLLISSGVIMGFVLIYTYVTIRYTSSKLDSKFNCYSLLKLWEVNLILEELTEHRKTFTKHHYNEFHLSNKYIEFNLQSFAVLAGEKAFGMQEKYNKQNQKTEVKSNIVYPSVKRLSFTILMLFLVYLLSILTVVIFLQLNQSRLDMQEMYYTTHRKLFKVQLQYSAGLLYSTYGDFIPLTGDLVSQDLYRKSIDEFIQFVAENRIYFPTFFGSELGNLIDRLFLEDICTLGEYYEFSETYKINPEKYCAHLDILYTQKGLIGFLHNLRLFLDAQRSNMEQNHMPFLQLSKSQFVESPRSFYFDPEFTRVRIASRTIFRIAYELLINSCVQRVVSVSEKLIYYAGDLILYPGIVLSILMLVSLAWTVRQAFLDIEYTFELFFLIDPYYLLNNRYLMNRLKASFAGISS